MKQYDCTYVNFTAEAIVNRTTGATGKQTTHNAAKESDGATGGLFSTTPKLWTIHFNQIFRIHIVCWTAKNWAAFSDSGLPSRTILDRTYSAQRFFIFSYFLIFF